MKKRKRIIKLLAVLLCWFLGHVVYTMVDGLTDNKGQADLAVILGCKVNRDGTLSPELKARMVCGLELYQNGHVKKILVTGGLGKEGFYEGDKMKEYLMQNGVPDSAIIVDNLGNNTVASVKNTLALKDSFNSLIIVSQYFHLTRTKMMFRKRGFDQVSSASPYYFRYKDVYALAREFAAFYVELLSPN